MPQTITLCPYLGLDDDPSVRLSYADGRHRCYADAEGEPTEIDTDYQLRYCLAAGHTGCVRFQARQATPDPAPLTAPPTPEAAQRGRSPVRLAIWASLAIVAAIAVWRLVLVLQPSDPPAQSPAAAAEAATAAPLGETEPAFPTPDPQFTAAAAAETTATPGVGFVNQRHIEEIPTPTLAAGESFVAVTPQPEAVGWVTSSEARGNHLGDSYLHTGVFDEDLFHGVVQFDLSRVPRGAPIHYATLVLTGLDDRRLDPAGQSTWQTRWLAPAINDDWSRITFQDVHNAEVFQTILPPAQNGDLAPYAVNQFVFDAAQLALLQQALLDGQTQIALRLDGPQAGANDVFAWDTGFGPASRGNAPVLRLVTGAAPATPPPVPTREFVVVTSTPTPVNVLTVAAVRRTEVAVVLRFGTATPTPRSLVTATPTPENEMTVQAERLMQGLPFVVTATPQPANRATVTANAAYATAVAITTGTFTPLPTDYVTATPTATFVVVTNTPTASDIFALLALVIAEATRTATAGPPTPFPPGVVTATPTWTATPFPLNEETAVAQAVWVTIQALTTGTWTPTATATATGTPPAAAAVQELTATFPATVTIAAPNTAVTTTLPATSTVAATSSAIAPRSILFRSDRLGEPRLFSLDPQCIARAGGCTEADVVLLPESAVYDQARDDAAFAPNRYGRVIVQLNDQDTPQVYLQDFIYDTIQQVTSFTGASYDPVWSPVGSRVLFVSNEPGNDELYTISIDGTNANRLTDTPVWEKHPTWSPDGSQIVFHSNRDGRNQLWIMNADGTNQRKLLDSAFDDTDPVWTR